MGQKNKAKLWICAVLLVPILTACSSKEQKAKQREQALTDFATTVVQHMYDRNPATIKDSMNVLLHSELTEATMNKLQASKDLPMTEIDVLKIIDENQRKHQSNKVEVDIVRPLGPIEKDVVPMKVTGKDIMLIDGKQQDDKVISVVVTCDLTDEMGGYPRATDVQVIGPAKPPAAAATASTKTAPAGGKRRRRR